MPHTWNSASIIDDLAEYECLRTLYLEEALATAEETGCGLLVPDEQLDEALRRVAARYERCLQLQDGQIALGNDAPVAAVKSLYRFLHEEYVSPEFRTVHGAVASNSLALQLMAISPRGLVAYSFCYRFLVLVGWLYFGVAMVDDDEADVDALVAESIRNFEGNIDYSFDQMRTRAFQRGGP